MQQWISTLIREAAGSVIQMTGEQPRLAENIRFSVGGSVGAKTVNGHGKLFGLIVKRQVRPSAAQIPPSTGHGSGGPQRKGSTRTNMTR